jgi:hypothetical protein
MSHTSFMSSREISFPSFFSRNCGFNTRSTGFDILEEVFRNNQDSLSIQYSGLSSLEWALSKEKRVFEFVEGERLVSICTTETHSVSTCPDILGVSLALTRAYL